MKRFFFSAALLFLLGAVPGCIQYEYVGQKFPADENAPVTFYEKESDVPREKLVLIGRMTMTCDNYLDKYEVEGKLLEKARQYGADAVSFVSETQIAENSSIEDAAAEFSSSTVSPAGENPAGVPYEVNSFGSVVPPAPVKVYDWVIKALFWKNRETAQQEFEKRQDMLKDNVIEVVKKAPAETVVTEESAPATPEPPQE